MTLEAPSIDLEEILNLDPAVMEQIVAEFWREKPEELVKLEEEVKKTDPAMVTEMQKQKPLLPTPYQPKPSPRQRRTRRTREILREFEPAPRWWPRNKPGSLKELKDPYGDVTREGEETKGRRFTRWTIIAELPRPEGPLGTEPHWHHGKSKATHEFIFSWLSWLAVLLVGTYTRRRRRRRRRRRSRATLRR